MRILLQLPEGLKQKACEIADGLEREGHEVIVSASPCFGGCDLALNEAAACKARKIIQYGHAAFALRKKPKVAVEFVEYRSDTDFKPVLGLALKDPDFAKCKRVGLVTTVQHIGQLAGMKRFLEAHGKKVLVGKHGPRAKYDGQILGCDVGAALFLDGKVDCVLYFGGGLFHPIGAAVACRSRVISADPFLGTILWMDEERDRRFKRRMGALAAAANAKRFGIIVSVKPGQEALGEALRLKKVLEGIGKKASVLVTDFVNAEALENFRCFDAYVNTACPRIVIDDSARFDKPMLNLQDAHELASELKKAKKRK